MFDTNDVIYELSNFDKLFTCSSKSSSDTVFELSSFFSSFAVESEGRTSSGICLESERFDSPSSFSMTPDFCKVESESAQGVFATEEFCVTLAPANGVLFGVFLALRRTKLTRLLL